MDGADNTRQDAAARRGRARTARTPPVQPRAHGPELLFAVVRPVGTPDGAFHDALEAGLSSYGYDAKPVKLSGMLADRAAARGAEIPTKPEDRRIEALMDEGDDLCEQTGVHSAVALLGVTNIRELRVDGHRALGRKEDDEQLAKVPLPRTAYLLDSIKRPAEIAHLRQIYGDHVIVISLQASPDTREQNLDKKIRPQRSTSCAAVGPAVKSLMDRDLQEDASGGQNTLKAFPMADVFIDVDDAPSVQVHRLLDLLFGNPDYRPPTAAEFAMSVAQLSSTRSAELGLKVGAALVREDHTVLSVGVNAHPHVSGSPAYDPSAGDIRELLADTLRQLPEGTLVSEHAVRLEADSDAYVDELLAGPLAKARIRDLTEFQVPIHAEMNALLDVLRIGASLTGATVYVTSKPCHSCTKHLLKLKLPVRYIEPYPKGRAEAMYGAEVNETFLPFTGVAPRRYATLFTAGEDRKNRDGSRPVWGRAEKKAARPLVDLFVDASGIADREARALAAVPPDAEPSDTPAPAPDPVGAVRKDATSTSRTRKPNPKGGPGATTTDPKQKKAPTRALRTQPPGATA